MPDALPSRPTTPLLLLAAAFTTLLVASGWVPPYERFHDEFYYWVNARRLDFGYVDHPPLAPWLLAATLPLLGDGRIGMGLPPALCGAGTLWLAAAMARRFGAGHWGQGVAALAVAVAPFHLVMFGFYSVNAIDILSWTAASFLLVEFIRTRDARLWLAFGAVAGLALLNKHTFGLLALGLGAGVVATPLRAQLRSPWLWGGALLACALASPNLVWNALHEWPSLDFYRTRSAANLPTTFGDALTLQLGGMNPANTLLWAPGLAVLLFSRRARPYRPLGIAFLLLFAGILLSGLRRGDRIAGAYPIALAAGAAFWTHGRSRWRAVMRWAIPSLMLVFGVLLAPIALPLASPRHVTAIFEFIGEKPEIEASDVGQTIPVTLQGRLGWRRFAHVVFDAVDALPREERRRTAVLTPHWLFAAVLEYYGRDRELPPIVSPHNAYYFSRAEAVGRDVVVSVAIPRQVLARYFDETRVAAEFACEYCTPFRQDQPVYVSRGLSKPLEQLLADWKHFGITPAPLLHD